MLESAHAALHENGHFIVTAPNAFRSRKALRVLFGVESVHEDHVAYYSHRTTAKTRFVEFMVHPTHAPNVQVLNRGAGRPLGTCSERWGVMAPGVIRGQDVPAVSGARWRPARSVDSTSR